MIQAVMFLRPVDHAEHSPQKAAVSSADIGFVYRRAAARITVSEPEPGDKP
ncbi:MAG: hypothetical protein GY859_24710 [Desulfobacterales bacterium]|nr:hypothetical protein [Desulfobacterales bacterium]